MDYTPPQGTVPWLAVLFFLAALAGALIYIYKALKGPAANPPNESLAVTVTALTARVDTLERQHAEIRNKIDGATAEIQHAGEERAHVLHERLNPAVENIAEIKGQMSAFTQSFNNFTQIITNLALGKKL